MTRPLTPEERKAIRSLKELARRWPPSLWLFSGSGKLHVMLCGAKGERVHLPEPNGGVDPDYIAATVNIPNDGGDW